MAITKPRKSAYPVYAGSAGGAENYRKAYQEKLQEVLASGEQLDLSREEVMAAAGIKEKQSKTGDGSSASGERVLEQKQPGLYTVIWHPIGGQPAARRWQPWEN